MEVRSLTHALKLSRPSPISSPSSPAANALSFLPVNGEV